MKHSAMVCTGIDISIGQAMVPEATAAISAMIRTTNMGHRTTRPCLVTRRAQNPTMQDPMPRRNPASVHGTSIDMSMS